MISKNISKKTWIYEDLCFIIPLTLLRRTPNVEFYTIPDILCDIDSIDKVIHNKGAMSPTILGDKKHYWYMHTFQEDKLIVHQGIRIVDLYSKKHNKIETFEVSANYIKHNGKIIFSGESILGWPKNIFHRVKSPNGSISTNYAKHIKGFNLDTNFNIYDIDFDLNKISIARSGNKDQPKN